MDDNGKGRICVTGGTGYIGSWIVKRLLEEGYSVNTTTRLHPGKERDLSFLENLDGAADRLQIFHADLDSPESFIPAIEGCAGVFLVAHPLDLDEKEPEEVKLSRVTAALKGILKACADSKTVRRVLYTSTVGAVLIGEQYGSDLIEEDSWTDVELVRRLKGYMGPYIVTKTVAEKLAWDLAQELGLDLVSVCPPWVTGPFICPHLPDTVYISLALIYGSEKHYYILKDTCMVHVDDLARAHIHLFENPEAKGRYICHNVTVTIEEIRELISRKYPEYTLPTEDTWKDKTPLKVSGISSNKLIQTGFRFEHGLEDMVVDAVQSCNNKGFL